jgi:hypothetical protein
MIKPYLARSPDTALFPSQDRIYLFSMQPGVHGLTFDQLLQPVVW